MGKALIFTQDFLSFDSSLREFPGRTDCCSTSSPTRLPPPPLPPHHPQGHPNALTQPRPRSSRTRRNTSPARHMEPHLPRRDRHAVCPDPALCLDHLAICPIRRYPKDVCETSQRFAVAVLFLGSHRGLPLHLSLSQRADFACSALFPYGVIAHDPTGLACSARNHRCDRLVWMVENAWTSRHERLSARWQ